jgi:hypothetical protein
MLPIGSPLRAISFASQRALLERAQGVRNEALEDDVLPLPTMEW